MFLMVNVTAVCTVLFLIFLEGLLSMDNALVLAMLVRHLSPKDRKKALTYGIWGAFTFRALALLCLTTLMKLVWVKLVGGLYLCYVGFSGFFSEGDGGQEVTPLARNQLWRIIALVEFIDIAFSADSILASVSVSRNYWIVLTGGILGIATMRFAAQGFVWLMERFPRLELTAFMLVSLIGLKLILETTGPLDSVFSWSFRALFGAAIMQGFVHRRVTV